ncbi:MAG: FG-GAP-like repeat-containing protein, partial [Gemmatimonadaceae bacterium]
MARPVRSRILRTLVACLAITACKRETPGGFGAIVEAESLGATYLDANDLPKAEQAFKHLIALAPTDATARTKLGIVYVRMNRPKDAERQFQESAKLDTTNVDARLLLASLMSANGNRDAARQTLEGLTKRTPVDPKVYYALAELARMNPDSAKGRADVRADLESLAKLVPDNVPVRLALARALVATSDADGALRELESLEQLPPSLPREARPSFEQSVDALRKGNVVSAAAALATFQHFLEVTIPFQSGLEVLRAPQIAVAGMPQLTLPTTEAMRSRLASGNTDAPVVFMDATARFPAMGVNGKGPFALAVGDYDGDGSDDFLVSTGAGRAMLMHWQGGEWIDASEKAGVNVVGAAAAAFADVDDDGRLDLVVVDAAGKGYLYMNDGNGHFHDVAAKAGLASPGRTSKIIAADMDHDGDMDLVLATPTGIRFYRNNSDGTFLDVTAAAGLGAPSGREGVAFADLDDDGMLDLVAIGGDGTAFYHNTHDRRFEDHSAASGLAARGSVVAVADYDNDGYLDLFAGGVFYRNMHDGKFSRDERAAAALASLSTLTIHDALFVDYDNDGFQDLVIVGTPATGNGVRLLHNDGNGKFSDRSSILPQVGDASLVAATDLDRDRDIDLLVVGASGFHALRNDGGNRNLAIQVKLTGLTTGSGKNNALGIGATLEV